MHIIVMDRAEDSSGSGGLGLCVLGLGSGLSPILKLFIGRARASYFRARVGLGSG